MLWKGMASGEVSARPAPEWIAIACPLQQAHGSNRPARVSKSARLLTVSSRFFLTEEMSMWAKRGMLDKRTMECIRVRLCPEVGLHCVHQPPIQGVVRTPLAPPSYLP